MVDALSGTNTPQLVINEFKALYPDEPQKLFIRCSLEHLDRKGATNHAWELLNTLTALTALQKTLTKFSWSSVGYALIYRASKGHFEQPSEVRFQTEGRAISTTTAIKQRKQTRTILGSLKKTSSARTLAALMNMSLAQKTSSADNQLVLIWSAIESLLSNPPDKISRIDFYLQSMIPCICINYARRYACSIFDDINEFHPSLAKSIVDHTKSLGTLDHHTRFAYFMFHNNFALHRISLISALESNPLLQNRVWKLFENFSDPGRLEKAIASHEDRVRWQISRIYRARNSLVHGGDKPRYITPLTLNCFEYFKSVFFAIIGRAEKYSGSCDTEYLVASILFDYESYKSRITEMKKSMRDGVDSDAFLHFFEKA